jgi:hypothetical protein
VRRFLPIIIITLLALFAAQPLTVNQLTCSDDSAFHIGRAVNLEKLIDTGHPFPRWSPYMAHGYGYPFFNYYAPLTSYVLVALHKLGFIYPLALHITFFLCLWLAGLATYAFTREWFGDAAGVVGGVVYLTAPYFAYDILFRGNLAESFALIFPPLILFTLHRAMNPEHRTQESEAGQSDTNATRLKIGSWSLGFWDLASAISFAALLLTHNATALLATPLFIAYISLLAVLQKNWRTLVRGGLILCLGLALSAYFWLPALLETSLVQTDKLLVPPIFTYYTNFLTLSELFAPPAFVDPLLINPSPAKALGLVAAGLALVGFLTVSLDVSRLKSTLPSPTLRVQTANPNRSAFLIWLFILGLLYSLFTLSLSKPIWDSLPLINFIQFPWRFLSIGMLCGAILAGAIVRWLPTRSWETASAVMLVAAVSHLAWWSPRYCVPFQDSTLATTLRYELDTATLGTTAKGEYLPRTAKFLPDDPTIAQALINNAQPTYLTGLAESNVSIQHNDPLNYQASVRLTQDSTLTFNQFFFPGWTATADGQPLSLSLTPETGLISFALPAGTHTLSIYFGLTPLRLAAIIISILALLVLFPGFLWLLAHHTPFTHFSDSPVSYSQLLLPILSIILLFTLRSTNLLSRSAFDGQTVHLGQTLNANLAGGLTVLSSEYPNAVASDSDFDLNLYLTARNPVASSYRPRFDLADSQGFVWNNGNDALPPRWHKEPPETNFWPLGQYAQWSRRETVLPGTPPGDYELTVTIFDRATLAPDSRIDENGNSISPVTPLGTVHVTRPITPPAASELNIQYPVDHDFGPVTLLGYNQDRSQAAPGDRVLLTFFVRVNATFSATPISNLTFNLFTPAYPSSQWRPGDVWRFQTWARIPPETGSGPYRFALSATAYSAEALELTPIQVTAPDRVFTRPEIATPSDVRFKAAIALSGYDVQTRDNQLHITLLWQALHTLDQDLIAFIHVEDAPGHIVAQSDAVPANWSRPTLGWATGEYILDHRSLPALPAGEYTIYIGLADRITGERFGERTELGVYKAP